MARKKVEEGKIIDMFAFVFFGVITIVTFILATDEKRKKKKLKKESENKFIKFLEEQNFKISKEHTIYFFSNDKEVNYGTYEKFIVDDTNKKFALIRYNSAKHTLAFNCYEYSKLIDFSLIEDGEQLMTGSGLAAAGGALIFGTAGAVIGSAAGDRKIKNKCSEITIKIQINDLQQPLLLICLLKNCAKVNEIGSFYRQAKQSADNIIATLAYIDANK